MKIKVARLTPGQVLSPTGLRILTAPSAGFTTPSGYMELDALTTSGRTVRKVWRKDTIVTVQDHATA